MLQNNDDRSLELRSKLSDLFQLTDFPTACRSSEEISEWVKIIWRGRDDWMGRDELEDFISSEEGERIWLM
ncbi:hypothetical protein Tco_1170433 [Tanacetum coccineum]